MNTFDFIIGKVRAQYIIKELRDKVTFEEYDDDSYRLIFNNVSGLDLLIIFHAGIGYGHDNLRDTLMPNMFKNK
jgi:hypothetical protein